MIFAKSSTRLSLMDRSLPLFLIFSSLYAWSRKFWLFNCKFLYPISSHNSFITSIYPLFLPFSLQGGFSEKQAPALFSCTPKHPCSSVLSILLSASSPDLTWLNNNNNNNNNNSNNNKITAIGLSGDQFDL